MTNALSDITDILLQAARKAGADHADAIAVEGQSISVDVLNGALEHAERSEGTDIGLRVFIGQRTAIVSSSDTRADTIAQMAERAVAMAKEAPDDPWACQAQAGEFTTAFDVASLELEDTSPEPSPTDLEEDARRAEAAAQAISGVSQVQSSSAGYGTSRIHLATSAGFVGGYGRSNRGTSCVAITGTGTEMERDYYGDSRIFQSDLISPEDIGRIAAERAVARANARKPATGAYPVIFDERISSSLIGHLLGAVNGASVARGSSWAKDCIGEQILPDHMSLTEDPHRPRVGGSRPFDAEGLATTSRNIIENGILTGWTLDLATARQLGMESTASASRGTSSGPSPTSGNASLTQGNQTLNELLRDMGTGLLVTSMIGSTINPNTGDYSRGASGFWIENGEIQYPVNECTIAGNLRDMLKRIIPANDARMHLSRNVPSLMIEGMTLAGS